MSGRLRRWLPAAVVGCTLLSFLTGVVVGWVSVWFQLFGEQADREDYLVSFGGYAAGALVVIVSLPSLVRLGTAGWLLTLVLLLAALLVLLAIRSLAEALSRPVEPITFQHWYDGAGGVLLCPWTWPPLVLGVLAVVGRGPRRTVTERAAPQDAP